ncbi:GNAT family N-acetyltransferase [Candidatus Bipolaricaulota sp. J31]
MKWEVQVGETRLSVREFRGRHITSVIELFKRSFPRELEVSGFDEAAVRKSVRIYLVLKAVQRFTRRPFALFLVGEVDGEIVAAVSLNRERESWYIGALMVAPEHRRKGHGRAILAHALGVARAYGGKRAILHVLEDNTPAKRLYESAGFVRFERVVHMVREPPTGEEIPLPADYALKAIGLFDPRAARLGYEAMEPGSREVYGEPGLPPWYLRPLARLQPGIRERYAVTHGREWIGVYTFAAQFREKGAATAGVSLLREHRGVGLEEALLSQALRRAREVGCPRLVVRVDGRNKPLLSTCEELGFERLYAMEGMYREL